MSLPLTKTFHPDDLVDLAPELVVVDQYFTSAREQHPARRWEYAMALRAFATWQATRESGPLPLAVDVGGAGSPFWRMLMGREPPVVAECLILDPDQPNGFTLAQYLQRQRPQLFQAVFCLSVLEHVEDLDRFLYHLCCLVAPGGLLFLTMDCWDQEGPDTAHFHWMRKQLLIWPWGWRLLAGDCLMGGWAYLGDMDWTYHGHQLYGSYSFASMALVKRA